MAQQRRRRGRGEGSIFYREDRKCWACTVTTGQDENGKRIRKTLYAKTKPELIEKLAKHQADAINGLLADSKGKTVGQFLKEWLEVSVKPNRRPNTYTSYEVMVRVHISPRIGHVQLSKLTPARVQALYVKMEREEVSPRLRQLAHAVLHKAIQDALTWGYVARNVVDAVERPKAPKKTFSVLDEEAVTKFFAAAKNDRLYALYVVAVAIGLRQGELLALQWEDINLRSGELSVRHTLTEIRGKLTLAEPKTSKSRRRVTLPQFAKVALREHKERMLAEGHINGYVFCDTKGGPLRKYNLTRRSFKPLLESVGLPDIRFHDLRHTAATLLLGANVNAKVVQEILGHSTIALTLDTYSHVLPHMQTEAAEKMDTILRKRQGS